jgi:membrane protease YdiL (CAAX protease family)
MAKHLKKCLLFARQHGVSNYLCSKIHTPMALNTDKKTLLRLLTLLSLLLAGLFAAYFLYFIVVGIQCGFHLEAINQRLSALAGDVFQIRLIQSFQSFCLFILPPFVMCRIFGDTTGRYLKLTSPRMGDAVLGIVSIVCLIPILNVLVEWNQGLHLPESLRAVEQWMRTSEDNATRITELILGGASYSDLIINLLLVGIMAGVGEELLFRGLLLRWLSDALRPREERRTPSWVIHVSIWGVAILFSAIHLQFFGFFPRLLLGAWFGYLLWWSGSIWVPILAHFTNNALTTIAYFGHQKGFWLTDPDRIGLGDTAWLNAISLVLMAGILFLFLRSKKHISW